MEIFVPGNLLILGEYTILEENGLALSAAIKPCVRASLNDSMKLTGVQGKNRWSFDPRLPIPKETKGDLLGSCWKELMGFSKDRDFQLEFTGVEINSDQFTSDKGKMGFGSSAATALAVIKAIISKQKWKDSISPVQIQRLACKGHNKFQGKSGSSYDVYTSSSFGFNLFSKGREKFIKNVNLSFLPSLYYYIGNGPVSTISSVKQYRIWREENGSIAKDLVLKSNGLIRRFSTVASWAEAQNILGESKELGLYLGKQIGVSAQLNLPKELAQLKDTIWKASGAGNELAIIFSNQNLSHVEGIHKISLFEDNQNESNNE